MSVTVYRYNKHCLVVRASGLLIEKEVYQYLCGGKHLFVEGAE